MIPPSILGSCVRHPPTKSLLPLERNFLNPGIEAEFDLHKIKYKKILVTRIVGPNPLFYSSTVLEIESILEKMFSLY
jgi:hypothetical protein